MRVQLHAERERERERVLKMLRKNVFVSLLHSAIC